MGYCINQGNTQFFLDKTRTAEAFLALKSFAQRVLLQEKKSFSWVMGDTLLRARDLREFLSEWRWDIALDIDGSITNLRFTGEKMGSDLQLFKALAPYVKPGSFIVMHGEDGATWRWFFNGVTCLEQDAEVRFADEVVDVVDVEARVVGGQKQLGGPSRLLR